MSRSILPFVCCFLPSLAQCAPASNRTVWFDERSQMVREGMSPEAQEILDRTGFAATPSGYATFAEMYQALAKQGMPLYITTDCVLHAYHVIYDYTLRILESRRLAAELRSLLDRVAAETKGQCQDPDAAVGASALSNLAYLEVAACLLDSNRVADIPVRMLVEQETALILKAQGLELSPIFGYEEDYSQYRPRGHYTRSPLLERYFRAMMWLGRMAFRLNPEQSGIEMTRRALLLLAAAEATRPAYDRLDLVIARFVGRSDDLTLRDYQRVVEQSFPDTPVMSIARDPLKVGALRKALLDADPARILSSLALDTDDVKAATAGMRFLGQRYVPDSYILGNLVYNKVSDMTDPRLMPMGLDVMAVLGSVRAESLLLTTYGQGRYRNYRDRLIELKHEFQDLDDDEWWSNLYFGWFATLKAVLMPVPGFAPAYQDKCLQTALGSWAELRHDTILYAKQSYTVGITAVPPKPRTPTVHVEPAPEVFRRLLRLVKMTADVCDEIALADPQVQGKLESFQTLLERLAVMAERSAHDQPQAVEDQDYCGRIGDILESLESFHDPDLETSADAKAALVADVHTDPNTMTVLQVANDVPAMLFVKVVSNGTASLYAGGIFDYYEFTHPADRRLTDEEWQQLTPKPAKPGWIEFFSGPRRQ